MIKIIGIILSLIFSLITTYSFIAYNKCLTSVLIVEGIGQATIILSVIMSIMHFDKAFILFMCIGLILIIGPKTINGKGFSLLIGYILKISQIEFLEA